MIMGQDICGTLGKYIMIMGQYICGKLVIYFGHKEREHGWAYTEI